MKEEIIKIQAYAEAIRRIAESLRSELRTCENNYLILQAERIINAPSKP